MDSQYVQLKQLLVWEAKIHTSHLNQILNKEEKFYNVSYLTLTGELLEKIISSPKESFMSMLDIINIPSDSKTKFY